MTDVELILIKDIDTLRTRLGEHAVEYAASFGHPHLITQIVNAAFNRMRVEPFAGELTVNRLTGEPTFRPWFYDQMNSAAIAVIKASS